MRSCLKSLSAVLAAAGVALATLPYWMGAALPTVARLLHASVGSYEREGYSRFVLRNAAYESGTVRVTAARVRADTPLLWAWRHLRGEDRLVVAQGWAVRVAPSPPPPAHGPAAQDSAGLVVLHDHLVRLAAGLTRWLPRAEVSSGSAQWPSGGFRLASAGWNRGTFTFAGLEWEAGSAQGRAVFAPGGVVRVDAREPDRDWTAAVTWEGPSVEGHAAAWGQPIELFAHYGAQGWLPQHARAAASNWSISARQARLGESYGKLEGSAEAEWNAGVFSISARGAADPIAQGAPPLHLNVAVKGDPKHWSVKSLDIELPSGRIVLDQPISFGYETRPAFSQAALSISADLSAIPLLHARGKLSGRMVLSAAAGALPAATVNLTAKEAAWKAIPIGDYSISGGCDFQHRSVSQLKVDASWAGSALRGWLLPGAAVARIAATAIFDGPWSALSHDGSARVEGLAIPSVHADAASLHWRGNRLQFDAFEARMAAGKTTLSVAGQGEPVRSQNHRPEIRARRKGGAAPRCACGRQVEPPIYGKPGFPQGRRLRNCRRLFRRGLLGSHVPNPLRVAARPR